MLARRLIPPAPEDVPLPATFGDWYDLAARQLGVVERRDGGALRLLAGAGMILGVTAGIVVATGPRADPPAMIIGALLALGTLTWWFWFRRDWVRVRRLRRAWSWSIRDPRVLALPVRRHPGAGPDPEQQHDFRVRESGDFAPFPGLRSTGGVSGGLDVARALVHPLLALLAVVTILATLDGRARPDLALPVLPFLAATVSATGRAWRRLADAATLVGRQQDDRRRWIGWRVLRGLAAPVPARPWHRRLNWAALPLALGAIAVLLARIVAGEVTLDGVVAGVVVCAVPAVAVAGWFLARSMVARSMVARARGGDRGVTVRITADDVPTLGPTTVAPGIATFRATPDGAELIAGGGALALPGGAALVSGEPHLLATRRHWLMLPDGSQVPLVCAAVRPLRELAGRAGLHVL